jgi:flagellar export protein FliJ
MKGLATLMRLAKAEIDERQRAVADIESRILGLETQAAVDAANVEAEARAAVSDPFAGATLGAFLQAARMRRIDLDRRIGLLREEALVLRNGLNEAFLELKRLELVAERFASEAERAALLRENAELDEMAIARHATG